MLLEFKASNYKSFKDELVFSLIPAPKQKGLDYSVQKETIEKKFTRGYALRLFMDQTLPEKQILSEQWIHSNP